MFDRIGIRRPTDLSTGLLPLDIGSIAEALLFYGHTHVILDAGSLEDVIHFVGPHNLIRLARSEYATLHYTTQMTSFPMAGDQIASHMGASIASVPAWGLERRLSEILAGMGFSDGRSRRFTRPLLAEVHDLTLDPAELHKRVHEDLQQQDVLRRWVEELLPVLAPDYKPPSDWFITFHEDDRGVTVETSLDFRSITSSYQVTMSSQQNEISVGHLLLACASPQESLILAQLLDSDLSLTPLQSRLLALRGEGLATAYDESVDRRSRLLDFELNDSKAITEAVNSSAIDFSKILDLVDKSRTFHEWLAGQPADVDLLREYCKQATRGSWVEDLPVASARWAIVTGGSTAVGLAATGPKGMALGAGIGLVDFVAGQTLARRGPNHFLQRRVPKALKR